MTAAAETMTSSHEDAIRALSARWLAAVGSREVDSIVAYYADDGALLAPGAPLAEGRDAVRAVWTTLVGLPGLALEWTPASVRVSGAGEMAYEIGTYRMSVDGPSGRVEDEGKYLVVWRRTGDGWKVGADAFNSSRAAPS